MEGNDDTRATNRQAAQATYDSTLITPRANLASDEQLSRDDFDDDKDLADGDKQSRDNTARDNYDDDIDLADDDYDTSVANATTDYENYANPRTATFQSAIAARTAAYQLLRQGYFDTFDSSMQNAQTIFNTDVASAKQTYVDAKRGFASTRDGQINTARDDYNDAVGDLADDRNDVYDNFWIVNMPIFMGGGSVSYTTLYENQQKYEIAVARQDVYLAYNIGAAKVQYNANERTAATALAKSVADYTEVLAINEANAGMTLAHRLADAQEPYQHDTATLDAAYEIDMQTEFVDLMKDVALAEYVRAYDYAAAEHQLTIDLSQSAWTHSYDLALARQTFDKAMADAAHAFELAENGAFETLQNNLATAESTWIQSSADDAETRDNSINAAAADWIRDQYQAYVDYVADLGTAYLAYMPILATLQSAQFVINNGASADSIAVSSAWTAYTTTVAFAEVARANGTAAAWQAFGNMEATFYQISADMRAAANTTFAYSAAAALVSRVSDEAAAQHIYDDAVADAAKDFAHDEADQFRTRTEQEADADKTFEQTMAEYAEPYVQLVADAAYDYDIDYWDRHLANFTVETNAELDRYKDEQTELKNLVKEKATNERNALVATAGFRKTAAKDGADQDKRAALDLARRDFAAAVIGAFNHLTYTRGRPLSSFEDAAMSRIDTWGIGAWISEQLHWAWNEGLDDATNFVTGWSDKLTLGGSGWLRQELGIDTYVDYNSNAYAAGQIVGTVHLFLMGGAAGSINHVGWAYSVARGITTVHTIGGALQAANNIKNGNGTFWDYLSLAPGVGYVAGRATNGLGIFRCFVGDTPVVIRELENVALATPVIHESDRGASFNGTYLFIAVATVTSGWLGKESLDERRRRAQRKSKPECARDYDVDDPHRRELSLNSTEPAADPTLSPKEFDMLCDDLLSGDVLSDEVSSPNDPSRSGGRETSVRTLTIAATSENHRPSRRASKLGLAWMWACLLVAGGFFWSALPGSSSSPQPLAAASSVRTAPVANKYETKLIRDLRVGQRVLAHNPEVSDAERAEAIEPDPATWRHVSLVMRKPDGSDLHIEMLRPVDWFEDHAFAQIDLETPGWFIRDGLLLDQTRWEEGLVGRTIHLDLPEMGAAGPARVLSMQPCPAIEPSTNDDRQVVTATFAHSAGDVLDLRIAGEPKPIGTTPNHPFWSEDRQAFVPAAELVEGETLRRADRTSAQVARITPRRGPPATVYNLEVNAEHVYFVGNIGALVHNQYHHAVTPYFNLSRPNVAAATATSRQIILNADLGLGGRSNLRNVVQHVGQRHSPAYHQNVADTLEAAVSGLTPHTTSYTSAVSNALDDIFTRINSFALPLY